MNRVNRVFRTITSRARNIRIQDILERKTISRTELLSQEIEDTTPVSFLIQNGVGYILEIKVDKTPQEALQQIKMKQYNKICGLRKCYLIGLNIKTKEKKLEWSYEISTT
ncbi:hypothetical protein A4H02_00590 [Fervidobacterium thailandense]|uniref:Uncharacterized protein n=2 Tax=Fervidobacterium thailandense TaxID=1008305 RepID=A0A1E3G605_9BACT|nr:hypothetical protein A4H02_00590 [Fervidobacterium thailandense]